MLTSTLGGLIKDYRIKKRLSQLEVSLRIGWKDTTRLSKIEQGRVGRPTRETVDKIITALELNNQEKGEFLLVGGYLPTEDEILTIREKTKKLLDEWPYPSALLDFSWRIIDKNELFFDLYQLDKEMNRRIMKDHIRVIDMIYDPRLILNRVFKGDDLQKWHTLLFYVTAHFKYEQRNRTKEKWYTSFIRNMLRDDLFRKIWMKAQSESQPASIIGKYANKFIVNPENPKGMLNFYLFVAPVIEDPRFEMEMLVPMDLETYTYYH